jgi:hypothetical protein
MDSTLNTLNTPNAAATNDGGNIASLMASYFASEAKKADTKTGKKKQQDLSTINLSTDNTLGTVIVKLVYDDANKPPIPTRTIYGFYDVRVPYQPKDENGNLRFNDDGSPIIWSRRVRFMDINNYKCQITPDQQKLFDNVIANLSKWDEIKASMEETSPGSTKGMLWYEWRKQLTIFYGFLNLYTDKNNTEIDKGGVRLFRTHAGDFLEKFSGSIQLKSKMKGSDQWLADYINRVTGTQNKAIVIKTDRPTFGYETTVTFDECQPFVVSEEDLAAAKNINEELVDATYFDEDGLKSLNTELIKNIDAYINASRKSFGQAPAQPVQPTVSATANPAVASQVTVNTTPVNPFEPASAQVATQSVVPPSGLPM